jgi:hypothetical protein
MSDDWYILDVNPHWHAVHSAEFGLDSIVESAERKQVWLKPGPQCGPSVGAHVGWMPSRPFENIISCYQYNRFRHACYGENGFLMDSVD